MLKLQVAFLTGQSDPRGCALSPAQEAFLDALPLPEAAKVRRNFPYWPETRPHHAVWLPLASWHNARQFWLARRPGFGGRHRPSVITQLTRAERTLVLAGSCGLELLAGLGLPEPLLARLTVIAYGPAHRPLPEPLKRCQPLLVRGRWDWVSWPFCRRPDYRVAGGHLGYLQNPQVSTLVRGVLERLGAGAEEGP